MNEKKLFSIIPGSLLKEYRQVKGLKQEELAEFVGVSRQTLVVWEGKKSVKIPAEKAEVIKNTLNIKGDSLVKDLSLTGDVFTFDKLSEILDNKLKQIEEKYQLLIKEKDKRIEDLKERSDDLKEFKDSHLAHIKELQDDILELKKDINEKDIEIKRLNEELIACYAKNLNKSQ